MVAVFLLAGSLCAGAGDKPEFERPCNTDAALCGAGGTCRDDTKTCKVCRTRTLTH